MATDTNSSSSSKKSTFKCKYCGKKKPFDQMVVVSDYFPYIVVCNECAKNIR